MLCLKLDENVCAKLRLNDMNFDNIDNIYTFIDLLKITHMELHPVDTLPHLRTSC